MNDITKGFPTEFLEAMRKLDNPDPRPSTPAAIINFALRDTPDIYGFPAPFLEAIINLNEQEKVPSASSGV